MNAHAGASRRLQITFTVVITLTAAGLAIISGQRGADNQREIEKPLRQKLATLRENDWPTSQKVDEKIREAYLVRERRVTSQKTKCSQALGNRMNDIRIIGLTMVRTSQWMLAKKIGVTLHPTNVLT